MKTIIKKILLIYISLVLIFAPSSIVYAASAGGWAFNSFNVATSVVTALKGGASASVAVAKSPITSKIAKGIAGGVIAGAALPLAISQITGISLSALDWVLDPANNRIKYTVDGVVPDNCDTSLCTTNQYKYRIYSDQAYAPTEVAACNAIVPSGYTFLDVRNYNSTVKMCAFIDKQGNVRTGSVFAISKVPNEKYIPGSTIPRETKYIPIPTVADKIYDNAKTDTASASIVNDAVKEYVNEGSADVALDNAKADADATHGCGTGTTWNGSACVADTPTTPDTPFDPTDIIDAIGKVFDAVMSLPDVINNALDDLLADIKDFFEPVITKFNDFVDWVKQEPPQDEAPKNVPVGQLSDVELENFDRYQKRIYFPPHCPSTTFELSVLGVHIVKPVDFSGLCSVLEAITPLLLAATYISCAFFVIREI